MKVKIIKTLSLALCINTLATAAYAVDSGFFMGLQVGNSNVANKTRPVYWHNNNPPGNTIINQQNGTPSNTGMAYRLFVGGQYNEYFAAELGYTRYAPSTYKSDFWPNVNITGNPQIRTMAIDLVGKAILPLSSLLGMGSAAAGSCGGGAFDGGGGFGLFGKAGIAAISSSGSGSFVPLVTNGVTVQRASGGSSQNKTSANLIYGLGISYDVTQSWVVDLSWTQINAAGGIPKANFLALGFSYHIVNRRCGQFLC